MTEHINPNMNDLRSAIMNSIADVWDRAKQVDDATEEVLDLIEADRQANPITGETSDGYHTFNELYAHRVRLFCLLMHAHKSSAWWSHKHHDGSEWEGWIIAGIDTPEGSATYHLPVSEIENLPEGIELPNGKEWDGYTSDDVLDRLLSLRQARGEPVADTLTELRSKSYGGAFIWLGNHSNCQRVTERMLENALDPTITFLCKTRDAALAVVRKNAEAPQPLRESDIPAEPSRGKPVDPETCSDEVYKKGVSIGLFDMPKDVANAICAGISSVTGARVDWHYIGGRVHMKVLPAPQPQQIPEDFLRSVINLCTHHGASPFDIEGFDPEDKWIADLWRKAKAILEAAPHSGE